MGAAGLDTVGSLAGKGFEIVGWFETGCLYEVLLCTEGAPDVLQDLDRGNLTIFTFALGGIIHKGAERGILRKIFE